MKIGSRVEVAVELVPHPDDVEAADHLLVEWYEWSKMFRFKLGYPSVAPYCQAVVSSRQWEDSTDASCGRIRGNQMLDVEYCVERLETPLRGAIGIEMRNRQARAAVWRHPSGATYATALAAVIVEMRKKSGLLD